MNPLFRWSKVTTSPGHCRFELRVPALRVGASVERNYHGRWFWVAYVDGAPGKSKRVSASSETARASALRWVRAELARFEAEKEYARRNLQARAETDRLLATGRLTPVQEEAIRSYLASDPCTERALRAVSLEGQVEA